VAARFQSQLLEYSLHLSKVGSSSVVPCSVLALGPSAWIDGCALVTRGRLLRRMCLLPGGVCAPSQASRALDGKKMSSPAAL